MCIHVPNAHIYDVAVWPIENGGVDAQESRRIMRGVHRSYLDKKCTGGYCIFVFMSRFWGKIATVCVCVYAKMQIVRGLNFITHLLVFEMVRQHR